MQITTEVADLRRRSQDNLDGLHDWHAEEGITDATMLTVAIEAQTNATLALVEEQRTTNLIAWYLDNSSPKLQEQIERRLGIQ